MKRRRIDQDSREGANLEASIHSTACRLAATGRPTKSYQAETEKRSHRFRLGGSDVDVRFK
jgi:hypothetical protein